MRKSTTIAIMVLVGMTAAGCTEPGATEDRPPAGALQAFSPEDEGSELDAPSPLVEQAVRRAALDIEEGQATFYADVLDGRRTASGETFRQGAMVAAHRAFPFDTRLRVTNTDNDRSVEVRVIDRGPFGDGRGVRPILDLSRTAAERLGFLDAGRANVRVEVLEWGT